MGLKDFPSENGVSFLSKMLDAALEASVVGSFSAIGPMARSRIFRWSDPERLDGKTVVITGATSGIGRQSASKLASLGARLVFVARDRQKAESVKKSIVSGTGNRDVSFYLADLSDLDQVRALAAEINDREDKLDVLIHNAGALSRHHEEAPGGTEVTVASQLLAPFLMTALLLPLLDHTGFSRVIQVSSGGMYTQKFKLSSMQMGKDDYDGATQYARVKRAQLVLMHEWARRPIASGVHFDAMHPGWVDTPGLRSGLPGFYRWMRPILRTPEQGADTVVWLSGRHIGADPADNLNDGDSADAGFWLDRAKRSEYKLPFSKPRPGESERNGWELWNWCSEKVGWSDRRS